MKNSQKLRKDVYTFVGAVANGKDYDTKTLKGLLQVIAKEARETQNVESMKQIVSLKKALSDCNSASKERPPERDDFEKHYNHAFGKSQPVLTSKK